MMIVTVQIPVHGVKSLKVSEAGDFRCTLIKSKYGGGVAHYENCLFVLKG